MSRADTVVVLVELLACVLIVALILNLITILAGRAC